MSAGRPPPIPERSLNASDNSRRLHRKAPSLSDYQTTPIQKHYQVAASLLQAFDSAYAASSYDLAYAIGLQFVETVLLELPKHGYFYAKRHERERMQSALDAVRVLTALQELQQLEKMRELGIDTSRVERLSELAIDRVNQASDQQYEQRRAAAEHDFRTLDATWCEPILACQDSWSDLLCPSSSSIQTAIPLPESLVARPGRPLRVRPDPDFDALPIPASASSLSSVEEWTAPPPPLLRSTDNQEWSDNDSVWSGRLSRVSSGDRLLERALYLSGLEVTPTVSLDQDSIPEPTTVAPHLLPLETLADCYRDDFEQLRANQQIRISLASTYQGRLPESTNGCTVIAPLLCIHHLIDTELPDPGLPDAVIEQVIDQETPAILSQLRGQLGLSPHAFLIPSDAHEYLIDNGQLSQEQFLEVTGGNILDEEHLSRFVTALQQAKNRKVAACFFFHEHVVAILKVRRSPIIAWYDLIDGLPLKQTLQRANESDHDFGLRLALTESQEDLADVFVPKTARMRCLSEAALTACLRWYACSKFTSDNRSYINEYEWNDHSCDFDPRVFQGFVWGSQDD